MNSIPLLYSIDSILQPDIKCYVRNNEKTNTNSVEINYYTLGFREVMLGDIKDAITNIGYKLYTHDIDSAFIQIFDETDSLICNQNIEIRKNGGLRAELIHTNKKEVDFFMDIIPDANQENSGFYYSIKDSDCIKIVGGTVLETSCKKPVYKLPKDIFMKLCFQIIQNYKLGNTIRPSMEVQANIHQVNFKKNYWNITVDPFTVTVK